MYRVSRALYLCASDSCSASASVATTTTTTTRVFTRYSRAFPYRSAAKIKTRIIIVDIHSLR